MTMMESSSSIPPLLIRNLISSIFIFADKSFLNLSQKSKLLQLIRCVLVNSFLFFLRLLPPLNHSGDDVPYRKGHNKKSSNIHEYEFQRASSVAVTNTGSGGSAGSAIGRALSQLLSLMNDIPVSSRKYQVVRSLAETLIEDNHKEGIEALRQVNRTVLSAAFSRTLGQLEAAAALEQQVHGGDLVGPARPAEYRLSRVLRAVRSIGDVAWLGAARASGSRSSAEKLAAEVLWLAEKLAACGYGDEAVVRWASASNLAWLSVSVEPSLQASLVKVSALLFKHAKDMGMDAADDDERKEQQKQRKMQMLMSWLPLLCRASNGTDVPVLSIRERAELERVLEDTIEMLEKEEDQEKVLSLWLHHFTYCSSSDWPNLNASYARWCNASRKLLLHHHDI
ncbi:uncharacterized protein Pyn_33601 [Prunus yedoensis var. nudiflora]|uniref:1,8-cineole synthase n=1 Tax=Prunus yedoensis var. nudiflora TaxID=2094558 RepID=A0A314ZG37_PRUYE|nr:uncharacterized protein Pyn_33601 [Prunus yedoensis var. nudiflora]